jgi:plastocyanin
MRIFRIGVGYILFFQTLCLWAQARSGTELEVSAHVRFENALPEGKHSSSRDIPEANLRTVIWLEPLDRKSISIPAITPGSYTMVQQDRQFVPHLLVVPVGSTVTFPNKDPFFHNVFSLFNGRRFDLGLYQSGQARTVTFNRLGISYLFCNIHPEMGAVIITLDTPFYGLPNARGDVIFHNVPEGTYTLHVWSENTPPEKLKAIERSVSIETGHTKLEEIAVPVFRKPLNDHLNKFGLPYDDHSMPY